MKNTNRIGQATRKRRGSVSMPAYILVVTLAGIGVIVGAVTIRNQIVQEYGDVGVSLNNLDQSFSYSISIDTDDNGTLDTTFANAFNDTGAGTPTNGTVDDPGAPPAGLEFVPPGSPLTVKP